MVKLFSFNGRLGRWAFLGRLIKALALTAGSIFATIVIMKAFGYGLGLPSGLLVLACAVILITSALTLTGLAIRRGRDIGFHWITVVALIWMLPIADGLFPRLTQHIEGSVFSGDLLLVVLEIAVYPILAFWPGLPQKRKPDETMAVILR